MLILRTKAGKWVGRKAGPLSDELRFGSVSWIEVTGYSGKASSKGVVVDVLLFPGKVPLCPPRIVVVLVCSDWFSLSDRVISMGFAQRGMLNNVDGRLPHGSGELGRLLMEPGLAPLKEDMGLDGYSICPW